MKVLIVDDEQLIRDVIKEYCEIEKYKVYEASNGLEAINFIENNKVDIVIMDIMMPKMDGYQALSEIKKICNIPCIMLSARGEEYDKLAGFNLGVDDYITKPFSPRELIARIKAVLKRNNQLTDEFLIGPIKIDNKAHEVIINNNKIELTPKEYELLCYLATNLNIALSREQILTQIWGYDFFGDDRTIDTHIKTLRNRLGKERTMIKTVRGMGYKLEYHQN